MSDVQEVTKFLKNANKLFGSSTITKLKTTASTKTTTTRRSRSTGVSAKPAASGSRRLVAPAKQSRREDVSHPRNLKQNKRKRVITWQNYENIFRIKDDLRFQFPVPGYDRFSPVFVDLYNYFESRGKSSNFLGGASSSGNVISYVPLAESESSVFVDCNLFANLSFDDLLREFVLPTFGASLGTFDLPSIRAVNVHGLNVTKSIRLNAQFVRLLSLVSHTRFVSDLSSLSGMTDMSDEIETESSPSSSVVRARSAAATSSSIDRTSLGAFVKRTQQRYREFLESRLIRLDHGGTLWCACCSSALKVLVSFGDQDDGNDWNRVFRTYKEPALHLNVKLFLSWAVDEASFVKDFVMKHDSKIDNKKSTSFLNKTVAVHEMGFFKRMYVVHVILYFLVMFAWTKHRMVHDAMMLGSSEESTTNFPVLVVVQRKLRPIFTEVKTLFWLKLTKSRKIFVQYV